MEIRSTIRKHLEEGNFDTRIKNVEEDEGYEIFIRTVSQRDFTTRYLIDLWYDGYRHGFTYEGDLKKGFSDEYLNNTNSISISDDID